MESCRTNICQGKLASGRCGRRRRKCWIVPMRGVCQTCRDGRVRSNGLRPANHGKMTMAPQPAGSASWPKAVYHPSLCGRHSGALDSSITPPPVCFHRLSRFPAVSFVNSVRTVGIGWPFGVRSVMVLSPVEGDRDRSFFGGVRGHDSLRHPDFCSRWQTRGQSAAGGMASGGYVDMFVVGGARMREGKVGRSGGTANLATWSSTSRCLPVDAIVNCFAGTTDVQS
jgi:hypothetical protein